MTFRLSTIYDGNVEWLEERTIFLTKYGSHAYGTSTPESDLDLRGVCIAPLRTRLGFLERFDMVRAGNNNVDLEIYDLPKFLHGCAEGHPNMLEVLFTHPDIIWDYARDRGPHEG